MVKLTRRTALVGMTAAPVLAMPAIVQAQGTKSVKIGLVSDLSGPYRDIGGPGSKVAAEMAVADFGGSVLGRPIEVLQADCMDKPDTANAISRRWIDTDHVDVLSDGAASSVGLAMQQVSRMPSEHRRGSDEPHVRCRSSSSRSREGWQIVRVEYRAQGQSS